MRVSVCVSVCLCVCGSVHLILFYYAKLIAPQSCGLGIWGFGDLGIGGLGDWGIGGLGMMNDG